MKSTVYFADLTSQPERNVFAKLEDLLERVGIRSRIRPNKLVAIKLHFGERGNAAFVRPIFIRVVVDKIKECKGHPFLTDTNTLYKGSRGEAVSHLMTAIAHGFDYSVVGAPLIIADGIYGNSLVRVNIGQHFFREVSIGSEIVHADSIISVAHYKCHELAGFGGALKNIGMGCAAREGKLQQHSQLCPSVQRERCVACGSCSDWCPVSAIALKEETANVDSKRCIGCGECVIICPEGAIKIQWGDDMIGFQKKMVEHAYGALKGKGGRATFVNFITQVNPACDCYAHSGVPIVPDVGIVASIDPVAIDQASTDLVNQQPGNAGSELKSGMEPGGDKIRGVYPDVDWSVQLEYAEKVGLGQRAYELMPI